MQGSVSGYYFLLCGGRADGRRARPAHRGMAEENFRPDIDFECDDALAKLDRLALLRRDGDRLSVIPLDEALVQLDRVWDNFFPFDNKRDVIPAK